MAGVDLFAAVTEGALLAEELDKLVRLALDRSTTIHERNSAAMRVCERLHDSGILKRLALARPWLESNRERLQDVLKAASTFERWRQVARGVGGK